MADGRLPGLSINTEKKMNPEERQELDKMLQDVMSLWMGIDEDLTRTDANRQVMCLQDISIIHMMVNVVLDETDDPKIQLYIMDAIMKIVWRLMEVNGMGKKERNVVLGTFFIGTKFEGRQQELLNFRMASNIEFMKNMCKKKNGEENGTEH